jgi:hypothetical protein
MHAAGVEAEGVEATAASFEVGTTCLLVAPLGALQDDGDAFEVGVAVLGVKGERSDQRVGGVVDLAQGDGRVFPPAAARSGGPRTNG